MRLIVLCLSIALIVSGVKAQDTLLHKNQFKFYCNQQVALVIGENALRPAFQFTAGARYRAFHLGLGAAINTYYVTSVPLYVDARYTFPIKNVSPFVFVNGGFNTMAYALNNQYASPYEINRRTGGSYADAGIGFKVKLGQSLYYTTSLSRAYKKSVFYGRSRWGWWPQAPQEFEKYVIENNMVILKAGLEF